MSTPIYLNVEQARRVLAERGIEFSIRQMKRAAEKDGKGQRKIPFFVCPIANRLRIEQGTLLAIFDDAQKSAAISARISPPTPPN